MFNSANTKKSQPLTPTDELKYSSLRTGEYDDEEDDDHDNSMKSYAQKRMFEQDQSLDLLSSAVSRLGNLSLDISKEIDVQNRMLDDLEGEVEGAEEKASNLLQKTKDVIKRNVQSTNYCCMIASLTALLLFLILLVIYT